MTRLGCFWDCNHQRKRCASSGGRSGGKCTGARGRAHAVHPARVGLPIHASHRITKRARAGTQRDHLWHCGGLGSDIRNAFDCPERIDRSGKLSNPSPPEKSMAGQTRVATSGMG